MSEAELHRRMRKLIDEDVTDGNAGFPYLPPRGQAREGDHDLTADLTEPHYTAGQQTAFRYSGPYSRSYPVTGYDVAGENRPATPPLADQLAGRRVRPLPPPLTEVELSRITLFGVPLPAMLHAPLAEAIETMGWGLDAVTRWELADGLIVAIHIALAAGHADLNAGLRALGAEAAIALNAAEVPRGAAESPTGAVRTLLGLLERRGVDGYIPLAEREPYEWDSGQIALLSAAPGGLAEAPDPSYVYSLGRLDHGAVMTVAVGHLLPPSLLGGLDVDAFVAEANRARLFIPPFVSSGFTEAALRQAVARVVLARRAPRPYRQWTNARMEPGGFVALDEGRPTVVTLEYVTEYNRASDPLRALLSGRLALRMRTQDPADPLRILMVSREATKLDVLTTIAAAGLWLNLGDATTWQHLSGWWPEDGRFESGPERMGATPDWASYQRFARRYGNG